MARGAGLVFGVVFRALFAKEVAVQLCAIQKHRSATLAANGAVALEIAAIQLDEHFIKRDAIVRAVRPARGFAAIGNGVIRSGVADSRQHWLGAAAVFVDVFCCD